MSALIEPFGSKPVTIGPDELEAENTPTSIGWETELPGGFGPGSFTLPLPPGVPQPDRWLLGGFKIFDADTDDIYYEGRVTNVSSDTAGVSVSVETEGWSKHLSDDTTAREIFIDRDLSNWGEATLQRKIDIWNANYDMSKMNVSTGAQGAAAARPAILVEFVQAVEGPVEIAETWYDGRGIEISKVRYDFIAPRPGGLGTDVGNGLYLVTNDLASIPVVSGTLHHTTPESDQVVATTSPGYRFIIFQTINSRVAFSGPTSGDTWGISNVCVIGRHGLPEQGTWPDIGFLVSDMAEYAISKWAPLLTFTAGPEGSIETTSFTVPHAALIDEGTVAAMLESWSLFGGQTDEPLQWGVYERKRLFLAQPRSFGRVWRVRQDQTAKSQDQGADASERINGIKVNYDLGDGRPRSVGPVGSQSTIETDELVDTNPSNPANADGARHWATYSAGVMNDEQAKLVAGLILAKSTEQRWRGSITIEGWGYDEAGQPVAAALARAGDWAIVEDDSAGDTAPRQMRNTSIDGMSKGASCSVGAPPDELSVLLAKAGVVLQGNT